MLIFRVILAEHQLIVGCDVGLNWSKWMNLMISLIKLVVLPKLKTKNNLHFLFIIKLTIKWATKWNEFCLKD